MAVFVGPRKELEAEIRMNHAQRTVVHFMGKKLEDLTPEEQKMWFDWKRGNHSTMFNSLGPIPSAQNPPRPTTGREVGTYNEHEMLFMRMRWIGKHPFDHLDIHSCGEKTLVWIITKDFQSIVIEDSRDLYPSDTLVTQLRMLAG